ncbi:pyruvate dehydrogenase (acetyl-transferring) E1 component subunit alpha [Candidatus Micrarchaeota archaeon]|nr:pyruvate dehydrogenase (acetyl-transferring) E1 component subunit alpha [Candidatus Micrarchaeota archaeon]
MRKKVFEGSIEYFQVLDEDGKADKALEPKLPEKELKRMYELMVLCRVFDKKAVSLQRQGRMYTYAPLEGQEACQVGGPVALEKEDWVFPTYRDNGAYITRGAPLDLLYEYWMGFEEGAAMPEGVNVFPVSITVGNHLPMAVGMAWGFRMRKQKKATMVMFGDGATSQGDAHEAMNFASVYKAPCIFLCQNNQWAISTPSAKQMCSNTIAQRALGYGIRGIQVDGNDVLAVYKAVSEARKRAEKGEPTLVECITYRMGLHTTADDPKRYRSDKDVEAWKQKDPIERFRKYLKGKKIWNEKYERKVQEEAVKKAEDAVKKAETFRADPAKFFDFVYEKKTPALEEQKQAFLRGE